MNYTILINYAKKEQILMSSGAHKATFAFHKVVWQHYSGETGEFRIF